MTQYNPPPAYPPGQMPPPAGGGYGAPPPGGAYGTPPAPTQSNGWSIASLICGILGCIPFLTGLLAIVFGFMGLGKAKKTNSGRGLAVAGLVLGFLSILGWGFFAVLGGGVWYMTKANRTVATQFINDVAGGNVDAAGKLTDPASISAYEIPQLAATMKSYGTVQDVTTVSTNVQNDTAELRGIVKFSNGPKAYHMRQKKVGDDWKVTSFGIDDP